MTWYAAHLIQYFQLRDEPQDHYKAWENIVLIQADSTEEAFKMARAIGTERFGDIDDTLRLDDKPAKSVFGGVRKLVDCEDKDLHPGHGTEVTYFEFELDSEEGLKQLIDGETVTVEYEE
ncbi:MAG: DUF4288 domain-containing protein [Chloroflexota bacterium]